MEDKIMSSFVETTKHIFQDIAGIDIIEAGDHESHAPFSSMGILSMLSFTGRLRGRYILDLSPNLVRNMVVRTLPVELRDLNMDYLKMTLISKLCSAISEHINGCLDTELTGDLHFAPSIIVSGYDLVMEDAKFISRLYTTECGELKLYCSYAESDIFH